MKISILGSGYVGLCTGAGFALKGNEVVCVDVDREKVDAINSKTAVIEEKGLLDAMKKSGDRLRATTDTSAAVAGSSVTFVCVGTPSAADGSVDTRYLEDALRSVGTAIRNKESFHVVAIKSTVAPGAIGEKLLPILEESSGKAAGKDFGVCVNPEFLSEGTALDDFLRPDRIIVGENDRMSGDLMEELYGDFGAPVVRTDMKTAAMIKYASNAFLAAKITMMNEIGNICKKLGIDAYDVAKGIGYDRRIGDRFLNAGVGFGGSCFSKDVKALHMEARRLGYDARMLDCIIDSNVSQRARIIEMLASRLGSLDGKRVAVLGLAFKADTDDVRDSPAIDVVNGLLKSGCRVSAYDPKAAGNFSKMLANPDVEYSDTAAGAVEGADACVILTDWDEFRSLGEKDFSGMKDSVIIEGRRVLDRGKVKSFDGICW